MQGWESLYITLMDGNKYLYRISDYHFPATGILSRRPSCHPRNLCTYYIDLLIFLEDIFPFEWVTKVNPFQHSVNYEIKQRVLHRHCWNLSEMIGKVWVVPKCEEKFETLRVVWKVVWNVRKLLFTFWHYSDLSNHFTVSVNWPLCCSGWLLFPPMENPGNTMAYIHHCIWDGVTPFFVKHQHYCIIITEMYILEMWELGDILNDRQTFVKPYPLKTISEPPSVSPVIRRLQVRSPSGAQKSFSEDRAWWTFICHFKIS